MLRIICLALVLILASCATDQGVQESEVEPETIVFSYGYGTRGVATQPFGEDGPTVIACTEVYETI